MKYSSKTNSMRVEMKQRFATPHVALRKAQICMISFQTCTQIFDIHKALIHVMREKLIRQLYVALKVSTCMSTL